MFQSYLKTLKKKQREVTQKHQKSEGGIDSTSGAPLSQKDKSGSKSSSKKNSLETEKLAKSSFSDDSDLASLAREFEEEELVKESPFIRKVKQPEFPRYSIDEYTTNKKMYCLQAYESRKVTRLIFV